MSDKYIIRNCPCLEQSDLDKDIYSSCLGSTDYIGMCKDCTDCVMKQIYKLCKDDYTQFGNKELRYDTLEEIIKLLGIQEVE